MGGASHELAVLLQNGGKQQVRLETISQVVLNHQLPPRKQSSFSSFSLWLFGVNDS